ncbi:MAG TPA: hypothetical protein VK184_13670 [Nostocaceae cyanobacterium]|nr:hypothetical protein [Nostocaceae cyanobacterium]
MPTKSHSPDLQASKFLIPPSQRRSLIRQFTLFTLCGWVIGGMVSFWLEKTIIQILPSNFLLDLSTTNLLAAPINNIVFAVIFAAFPAFVLRRYLSGWLWMLATSIGWLLANSVSAAWINSILAIATSANSSLSSRAILFWGFISTLAYVISAVWLGICQWLVLRLYTKNSGMWIFLPSFTFTCISILIFLLSRLSPLIPNINQEIILYWCQQFFTALILGIIPALGLCNLKRNAN